MHKRLYSFLETQNCFYPAQFGFRLNVSTNNALMSIIEDIQTQLDGGKYCTGVFVALKKAFDTVDHNILLRKLRKQFVSIQNMSSIKEILTGIPQAQNQFWAHSSS